MKALYVKGFDRSSVRRQGTSRGVQRKGGEAVT